MGELERRGENGDLCLEREGGWWVKGDGMGGRVGG